MAPRGATCRLSRARKNHSYANSRSQRQRLIRCWRDFGGAARFVLNNFSGAHFIPAHVCDIRSGQFSAQRRARRQQVALWVVMGSFFLLKNAVMLEG